MEAMMQSLMAILDKSDLNDHEHILIWAAQDDNLNLVRYLIQRGVEIDDAGKNVNATTSCVLLYGSQSEAVRYLVEHGVNKEAIPIDDRKRQSGTALISAAKSNRLRIVRYLVEHGANKDARDNCGRTALIAAVSMPRLEVARYLVEQGANKEARDIYGRTALIYAAESGYLNVVRYLIEQGANKEARDNCGRTALIRAAQYRYLVTVRYLIEQGADANAKDKEGWTAFTIAIYSDNFKIINYLARHMTPTKEQLHRDLISAIWHPDKVRAWLESGRELEDFMN